MKNTPRWSDVSLVAGLLMVLAAPLLAVNAPNLGSAAGYTIIDSLSPASARADAERAYNELFTATFTADIPRVDLQNPLLFP